jgi:hypothetical protein
VSDHWIDSDDPGVVYRGARNGCLRWVIGLALVGLLVGGAVYFLTYVTAEGRGRIALHNEARSAAELRESYEYFHETCRDVIAQTRQIATLESQLSDMLEAAPTADPFGQYAQQVTQVRSQVSGLRNVRDTTAQDYNARSHEFTRNFMRSRDLPEEIGPPTGVPFDDLRCEAA